MVRAFCVLHVCIGNICRSPMAERLLREALRERVGDRVDEFYLNHAAGTGDWHVGESMNPAAARLLRSRGVDPAGFKARKVSAAQVDLSDLVLCATSEQVRYVLSLRPTAAAKTFVLGEFGRLLGVVSLGELPSSSFERGAAVVAAVDAARRTADGRAAPRPADNLDDPWGLGDGEFVRVADEIEQTVRPLADALAGPSS